MRHNDARKWLHAGLDLLPVLLIPVFMIYSHRHTMTEQTTVDIQYKYQSNIVNSNADLINNNIYLVNAESINLDTNQSYNDDFSVCVLSGYIEIESIDVLQYYGEASEFKLVFGVFNDTLLAKINDMEYQLDYFYIDNDCILQCDNYEYFLDAYYISGGETSLPFIYTDYNEIESVDVQDTNSSVLNVFMDNFNTAIDKYFNMGNVFNLNGVYQWFNTNIFGGNAPQIIYSVWNIALYELVMDLLFLLYGLFMWFIDICKHLMDKPFRSIK